MGCGLTWATKGKRGLRREGGQWRVLALHADRERHPSAGGGRHRQERDGGRNRSIRATQGAARTSALSTAISIGWVGRIRLSDGGGVGKGCRVRGAGVSR